MIGQNLRKVQRYHGGIVLDPRPQTRIGNQAGLYKHLNMMDLEGEQEHSSAYIKDEDGILPRDVQLNRKPWVRWFYTLFNAMSPKVDTSNIPKSLDHWPHMTSPGVHTAMQKLADAIRSFKNKTLSDRTVVPLSCSRGPSSRFRPATQTA